MEVGKLILNVAKAKAHMTLSVKPFGCMPSSGVSDGVQSLITEKYPQGDLLPIETNGDGAVNVYSRVQMMLFKARLAARAEYETVLKENGVTVEELRAYLRTKRWRGSSLFYPRHGTVASMAANLVQHVVDDIKKTRTAKIIDFTKRVIARRGQGAHAEPSCAASAASRPTPAARRHQDQARSRLTGTDGRSCGRSPTASCRRRATSVRSCSRRSRSPTPSTTSSASRFTGAEEDDCGVRAGGAAAAAPAREQAPVLVYFDGKDHRTKTKVEELLRGHDIVFQILDVTNDEAERSWIITAAKQEEFPIVVIAGTPVGGFAELTQLDVQGELKRRVFGAADSVVSNTRRSVRFPSSSSMSSGKAGALYARRQVGDPDGRVRATDYRPMASPPIARRRSLTLLPAALLLAGMAVLAPPATAHARGKKAGAARGASKKAAAPKVARQPKVTPNQEGKVVLLPFTDDDDRSIAALVERLLQARGLEVVTNVRGVDTAEQFRELAGLLGTTAFVDGTVRESGEERARDRAGAQRLHRPPGRAGDVQGDQASPAHRDRRQAVDAGRAGDGARVRRRHQATQARARADGDRGRHAAGGRPRRHVPIIEAFHETPGL